MKLLIVLSLFYCSSMTFGQNCVTIKEMISNFQEKKEISDFHKYDVIYGFEELAEVAILKTSLLPLNRFDVKNIRSEWCIEYSPNCKPMLVLKKMVPLSENIKDSIVIYENELYGKYGISKSGIPATWYSGKFVAFLCPQQLFGEIVTKDVIEFSIKAGEVISSKNKKNKTGEMESPRHSKVNPALPIPIASTDGCWYSNFEYQLDMLDEFVNDIFNKQDESIKSFDCSILLVTDVQGKSTMHFLEPQKLSSEKQKIVSRLTKRIQELPSWSFGWLETINGSIFQGRYLKATYSSDDGWRFKDYLR